MTRNEALKEIGEGLARVAAAILVFAEEGEKPEPREAKKEEPKATEPEKQAEEPKKKKTEELEAEKKYTLEDVRRELSAKSGAGFTDEVRELLQKHGATKLSGIKESEYAAIMEEVKAIGSAQ